MHMYAYRGAKMENRITFYISDKEKQIYKNAKAKAKAQGKSISEVIVGLLKRYIR